MTEAFKKLIHKSGGYGALAKALSSPEGKLTRQACFLWKGQVPERWLDQIEALYGILPWDLRPDLYRPRKRRPKKAK